MVRPLNISLGGTDVQISTRLRTKSSELVNALADKMLTLMLALQEKARINQTMTAARVPSERVQESVRNPSAEIQDKKIVGSLEWGGVEVSYKGGKIYDLAQIFEEGAKPHPINPLTTEGTRLHEKGAKTRFGADVLRWEEGGKAVFRPYSFHPGLPATHFMENAVNDMREQIKDELSGVIYDALE